LALDYLNIDTNLTEGLNSEVLIGRIYESHASPNTIIDAIQAVIRNSIRSGGEEGGVASENNALIVSHYINEIVVYNRNNVAIPRGVNMENYNLLIEYLDHYNAIIGSYDFIGHLDHYYYQIPTYAFISSPMYEIIFL
jgi:hypothetical protein